MVLRFLKTRSEHADNDKKLFFMDVKAMNILYYTLGKSEFDRIIFYKKCLEIYALEVIH
jgi:hypothetical protein